MKLKHISETKYSSQVRRLDDLNVTVKEHQSGTALEDMFFALVDKYEQIV